MCSAKDALAVVDAEGDTSSADLLEATIRRQMSCTFSAVRAHSAYAD
jgi:hypothetical protein